MTESSTPLSPSRGLLLDAEISAAAWRAVREREARVRAEHRRQAVAECVAVVILLGIYTVWCWLAGISGSAM